MRGVQGSGGSLSILGRLCVRLFANLFNRAENISQAMVARGFQGPEAHRLYLMRCNDTSWAANLAALALLGAIFAAAAYIK